MSDNLIKLYKGITFDKQDVRPACFILYNALEDTELGSLIKRAVDNVLLVNNSKSNLNFPIIIQSHIPADKWSVETYETEMQKCVQDLKESIRSKRPYGTILKFLHLRGLSFDWLMNYVNNKRVTTDIFTIEYDTDVFNTKHLYNEDIELGLLTGDIVKSGTIIPVKRNTDLQAPSIDTLKEEFEDEYTDTDLEDHLLDELNYDQNHSNNTVTLPSAPNPTGVNDTNPLELPDIRSTVIRKNHQPLPESKVAKMLHKNNILSTIDLSVLIKEITARLPKGTTLTITGEC